MTPPFRVEHIGSFVRPEPLLNAARAHKAGTMDDQEFRQVQDAAIQGIVAFQESIGLPSITDGEFRRRSWSAGFIDAVDGFGCATARSPSATRPAWSACPPRPTPRRRSGASGASSPTTTGSSSRWWKRGVPKVTIAAPDVMHYFLGPKAFEAYEDREAYFADLVKIYRDEIKDLAAEGCTYLQLDDTALPCNCDPRAREDVKARGEDAG